MKYLFYALLCIVFFSCKSSKLKTAAEQQTHEFLTNLKSGNEGKMKAIYKGFENFDTYSKSDSSAITSSLYKDGIVTVNAHNRFTNGYGKLFERDMAFYFKKDSSNKLNLFDSKGLTDFTEKEDYSFGVKTGCINEATDSTDQAILKGLRKEHFIFLDKGVKTLTAMQQKIHTVTWTWERGYGGSASGKAIVKNDSPFSLDDLRYEITYKDRFGGEITKDDGTVSYEKIEPGESKAFTFYTSYVGDAISATLRFTFHDKQVMEFMNAGKFSGHECDDYFKEHPEKLKEL